MSSKTRVTLSLNSKGLSSFCFARYISSEFVMFSSEAESMPVFSES